MTTAPNRLSLAKVAIALAAGLAMFALGASLVNDHAAVDTLYLATWGTVVLLAIAALGSELEVGSVALLSTLLVWAVPVGPTRSAAFGLLLVVAFFLILARRLAVDSEALSWQTAIASALGLQALCRAERFLDLTLEPRILIGLIVLPVIAGAALVILQRSHPNRTIVLAAMVAGLLVPGLSVTVTLSIVILTLGTLWRDRVEPAWIVMVAALATVVAAFFWQPALAGLLAATLLAVRAPEGFKTYLGLIGLAAVLTFIYPPVRAWSEIVALASIGPLLMPSLLVPVGRRRSYALCGAILGLLALRTVAGPGALAAPLAIAALSLRFRGTLARVQSVWTAALLVGSTLLAGYPWLRANPLEDALGLIGVAVNWWTAIGIVAVIWILTLISAPFETLKSKRSMVPWLVGGAVLFLALLTRLPSPGHQPFADSIRVLDSADPEISADLPPEDPVRTVVLDSYLDNSAALPAGTTVATVVLLDRAGGRHRWPIRVGSETGEWAARRADVAALEGFTAPDPWLSWVAPSGELFAQRYRSRWNLPVPVPAKRIIVRRSPDLADTVSMAVFHLELRR